MSQLENTSGLHAEAFKSVATDSIVMNAKSPLFENLQVREALSLGIDREAIIQTALGGEGEVAGSWFPPSLLYHDPEIKPVSQDVARSKELLAEGLGGSNAEPSFTLIYEAGNTYDATAGQVIQQDLEGVGFSVELQPLDGAAALSDIEKGDYDAAILGFSSDITDPSEMASFYTSTGGFFAGADTESLEAISKRAAVEVQPAKRKSLYYEIQKAISEEVNLTPLDYNAFPWAFQEKVKGFGVNVNDIPFFADAGISG